MTTSGALGGWAQPGGPYSAAELPPDPADAYGAGDCFAAGLAFALASGLEGLDALDFAARCGAGAIAGPGVHAEAIPSRQPYVLCARVGDELSPLQCQALSETLWGAGVAKWGKVE